MKLEINRTQCRLSSRSAFDNFSNTEASLLPDLYLSDQNAKLQGQMLFYHIGYMV
jgi:hypothetical protein